MMKGLASVLIQPLKWLVVNRFRRYRAVSRERLTVTATTVPTAPPLRKPAALIYKRFTRSVIAASFVARRAVKSNLTEVEHLTHRLNEYWRRRPHVSFPLPEMRISDTAELEVVFPADTRHPGERVLDQADFDAGDIELARDPAAAETQFVLAEIAQRSAVLAKEIEGHERDEREIERQMSETREKFDGLRRERDESIAAGTKQLEDGATAPASSGAAEQTPSRLRVLLCSIGQWALLLTDGIFIFVPLASSQGIDPSAIDVEWSRNPTSVLLALAPALFLAGVTFITLQWALSRTEKLLEEREPDRRRPLWIAAIFGAVLLALSVIWVTSSLRAQFSASASGLANTLHSAVSRPTISTCSYFLMSLAAVVGAVILHASGHRLGGMRAEAARRAATPTVEEAVAGRRAQQLAAFEETMGKLQDRRDINNAEIVLLSAEEQTARQQQREIAKAQQHCVEMFVDDVRAAISADKYAFRLIAKSRNRNQLLAHADPPSDGATETVIQMAHARRGL